MIERGLWICALIFVGACAPARYGRDDGGPSSENAFQRDLAGCRAQSAGLPQRQQRTVAGSPGQAMVDTGEQMQAVGASMQFTEDCLRSKGWVRQR